MQKLTVLGSFLLTLIFSNGFAIAGGCNAVQREGKINEFSIYESEEGKYKGYIALEDNGGWFVWIAQDGAMNKTYSTKEEAINIVCTLSGTK